MVCPATLPVGGLGLSNGLSEGDALGEGEGEPAGEVPGEADASGEATGELADAGEIAGDGLITTGEGATVINTALTGPGPGLAPAIANRTCAAAR